jgi:hypothetical protein
MGTWSFSAGMSEFVVLSNDANGKVVAGSVKFISTDLPEQEIILDNNDATHVGRWICSPYPPPCELDFCSAEVGSGNTTATWTPYIPLSGEYRVYVWWEAVPGAATDAPYTIYFDGGSETVRVNQQTGGGQWQLMGTWSFSAGMSEFVVLSNDANGKVVAGSVKFISTDLPEQEIILDNNDATHVGTWICEYLPPGTDVKTCLPKGGEVIPSGSTYNIQWQASSDAVKFDLLYSMNNGTTWRPLANEVTGTSYNWTVPTPVLNKQKCFVAVIGYNTSDVKIDQDTSDATFTVEVIKVISPNGGEVLTSGTTHTIKWQVNGTRKPVGKIQLFFTKDAGATWKSIAVLSGDLRSYNWVVPTVARTKKMCRVKVVISGTATHDASDRWFTITP